MKSNDFNNIDIHESFMNKMEKLLRFLKTMFIMILTTGSINSIMVSPETS